MNTKPAVIAFGEILWDLLPTGAVLGGAPANFAYRLQSLGVDCALVSRLGQDELGRRALEKFMALGMDPGFLQWDSQRPTGTVKVTLDERQQPDFFIVPDVAYDAMESSEALMALAAAADCVCFGTLIQRAAPSRATLGNLLASCPQAVKLLDINLRKDCFTPDTIRQSLARADILKLNEQELTYLAGLLQIPSAAIPLTATELLKRHSLTHCLVTLGDRGAYCVGANGEQVYLPGHRVKVADSCGSGDAFTAGFIREHLRKRPLRECCRVGNALGAMVATQTGATGPITPEDLRAFLATSQPTVIEPSLAKYLG